MTKAKIIKRLIQLAKDNPEASCTECSGCGTELRELLKEAQGKDYDPLAIDPPPKRRRKSKKGSTARMFEDAAQCFEMQAILKMAAPSSLFQRLNSQPWPVNTLPECKGG